MVWEVLCVLSFSCNAVLAYWVWSLHRAARELERGFDASLCEETNVGITLSAGDGTMRRLAACMDRQLAALRREHIRCAQGDAGVKRAVTDLSHDLRTPLAAISGYLELLRAEELPGEAKEMLSVIENRVRAMRALTEELLDYSVAYAAEEEPVRREVSLSAALEECVAAHYGALRAAGITPEIRMPEEDVRRVLDAHALARILANLMGNVIKYSEGDCEITLSEDGVFCFSNRARTLDPVQVGRMFDRFYTVEGGRRATGLGLSIARTLAEREGGTVGAEYRGGRLYVTVHFPM